MSAIDPLYELKNDQRKYFGLIPVEENWERRQLSSTIYVYFDRNKIVKVLNFGWGYLEYDTDINTVNREILVPRTAKGKEQKLTIARILKIKGSGVQFSGSFQGGNIHVYDNKRNVFFIKSYSQDSDIKSYEDIDCWISNYITHAPSDYFEWLTDQLTRRRARVKIEAGDFIAFKLTQTEFGFARILANICEDGKRNIVERNKLYWFHPSSIIVAPYAFFANTQTFSIQELVKKPTLPAVCMFDIAVYRGEMPIIGHMPLSEKEKQIPIPIDGVTASTLNISKRM
jgi:hypothetical protein